MKIENKLVSVKVGKKQFDLRNLITNAYLNRFAQSQLDIENYNSRSGYKALTYCLLKFDEHLELTEDIELHNQDFDVCFVGGVSKAEQSISEKNINVKYTYFTDSNIYDYSKNAASDIYASDYYGKKITAIGFSVHWMNDINLTTKIPVFAVVDTSNYNIYLQENQKLSITRQDIITSDAEFYCDNAKVKGPLHLAPFGGEQIIKQDPFLTDEGYYLNYNYEYSNTSLSTKGYLYSIGLSSYPTQIDKEFVIGKDIEAIQIGNQITFENIKNYFSKYFLYSGNNIYPSSTLYPCKKTDYKYVIFKYKVYQIMGNWQKTRSW